MSGASEEWDHEELFKNKLEKGRSLLESDDAYKGSVDLQHFVGDADATVAMHHVFPDASGQPRSGLSAEDKQKGLLHFLRSTRHKLLLPVLQLTRDSAAITAVFHAADELFQQHSKSGPGSSQALWLLGFTSIVAHGALRSQSRPEDTALEISHALVDAWEFSPILQGEAGPQLEALQGELGVGLPLTVPQLRQLALLLYRIAARSLLVRAQQAVGGWGVPGLAGEARYLGAMERATKQRMRLFPGQSAHSQQRGVDASAKSAHTEAAAAHAVALPQAEAEKSHLTEVMAACCLASSLFFGGRGPSWQVEEVQELLGRAEAAAARCQPRLPSAILKPVQAETARMKRLVWEQVAAGQPGAAALPSHQGTSTAPTVRGVNACTACRRPSLALRKCSGCCTVAYCSRECQLRHWKQGGHKKECGRSGGGGSSSSR